MMTPTFLAEHVTALLESPYKPFLMILPFIPWAWIISSKLEKDARYFHLAWERWNAIYLGTGVAALAAVLFIPIFWAGWPLQIVLLGSPILAYWKYRNSEVPESQKFYLTGDSLKSRMEQRKLSKASRDAVIQFYGPDEVLQQVPSKEDQLFAVHVATEDILGPAVDARATAVEINLAKTGASVHQTIDGIRYKRDPLPTDAGLRVIDYLKDIAGVDVEDRRKRQIAEFRMTGPNGSTSLAMTTAGRSDGVHMRIDFDRASRINKPFDSLGLLPSQMEGLQALVPEQNRHGIVLVGAPTQQGLTTTMYSMIGRHDAYTSNIKTLEREILLRLDGIDHVKWDANNPDVDYATALQSILRRDPDLVLVDQVTDAETARVVTEPGMQGPLIYVAQRASTIADQIRDWVKVVGDIKKATKSLRAVTNQRLLRSLCPQCRQPFQPSAEQLAKLHLPAGKVQQLYRANGQVQVKNKVEPCPVCNGSGYLGQIGVFEVMIVDSEARKLLGAGDLKAALAHARRNKMVYLQEAALSKVASGETTIDEVVRVTAPAKETARPVAAAAPTS